jgi:hypothetical protein
LGLIQIPSGTPNFPDSFVSRKDFEEHFTRLRALCRISRMMSPFETATPSQSSASERCAQPADGTPRFHQTERRLITPQSRVHHREFVSHTLKSLPDRISCFISDLL